MYCLVQIQSEMLCFSGIRKKPVLTLELQLVTMCFGKLDMIGIICYYNNVKIPLVVDKVARQIHSKTADVTICCFCLLENKNYRKK